MGTNGGNNNNNTNTNDNNNDNDSKSVTTELLSLSDTEVLLLSSPVETTQENITEELTMLIESSRKASSEMVDLGCDVVKAATNSIESFLIGPIPIPATDTPTTTTKEIAAYNKYNNNTVTQETMNRE